MIVARLSAVGVCGFVYGFVIERAAIGSLRVPRMLSVSLFGNLDGVW